MDEGNKALRKDEKKDLNTRHYAGIVAMIVLWGVCFAWYALPIAPDAVEHFYSRGVYRYIVGAVATVTGAVPFSVMLVLLLAAPCLYVALWIGNWIYRRRVLRLSHWRGAGWGIKWMLFFLPALWLWFVLFWGAGYQRMPMEERLAFDVAGVNEEEIKRIEEGLLAIIHSDQPKRESDRNVERAVNAIAEAMAMTVEEWEGRPIRMPKRVKATPPGLFLMNGTSGMCVPFTLEPHVDGGLPDTSFVAVAAHELGHIAGVCDEGETNLLGYVAGLRAKDPYARYAVALNIYRGIKRKSNEARERATQRLPQQAREDLERAREASQRYRIDWLQKWSWRAYNQYLKSQGVKEGVQSYGRGTELLVYAWRNGHVELPEPVPATGENEPAKTE
ncbi:MAG TPA: DUF3810 domain-containing protein [Candidatus Hydrogenedentes bacterium]|nr:DUF3810 domain-containing protein [Candidatus Hydrogenedentota bacterium]